MKTPDQVLGAVENRLGDSWADECSSDAGPAVLESLWPVRFSLGQPKPADLTQRFGQLADLAATWREWARNHELVLDQKTKRVFGSSQTLPTHLVVPDVDTAARLVGGEWPARLERGRARAKVLSARFPHLADVPRMLKATDALTDTDFDLLCRTAEWFAKHGQAVRGRYTARQVPVEGLHTKWLNTRQRLVLELAGIDDLGLVEPRRSRIHFTYLDPAYLATGSRAHDSATVGDNFEPPYAPKGVLICENKDTVLTFPPTPGWVAVEGNGKGAGAFPQVDWIQGAPVTVYWGDMDADGLEILNEFRAAGLEAVSLFMDVDSYQRYESYGVDVDAKGRPLQPRLPRLVEHLLPNEHELYLRLCSEDWSGRRRVEQERIPLEAAAAALAHLLQS